MTWHKDGQPLVLTQRTQALLGGQRLEIRDAQVSSPWHGQLWVAVGPGPGERGGGTGEPCGPAWGLLPPRPAGSHPESSGLQGRNHEKRAGLPSGSELTLSRSIPDHLPLLAWDLEAFSRPPSLVWMRLTIGCSSGKRCWPPLSWPSAIPTVRDFPPGSAGVQAQGRVGVWNLCPHLPVALLLLGEGQGVLSPMASQAEPAYLESPLSRRFCGLDVLGEPWVPPSQPWVHHHHVLSWS